MRDDNANVNGESQLASVKGTEIVLSVFLAWLFWPAAVYALVKGVGVEHWYYGEDVPFLEKRLQLWVGAFAAPFQVLTYPFVFAAFSGTHLDQLGLTTRRLGRNVLVGLTSLLVTAPVVLGVWSLVRWLYGEGGEKSIEPHVLETIARQPLYPSEWAMLFFLAMLAGPLHEELTFRGVLQPWLAARRWGGHAAMLGAFGLALAFRGERLLAAWTEGKPSLLEAAAPALFVLAVAPGYLLVWWCSRTPAAPAILGTSLLFACIHTSVWPSPIPLFVLALGLGVLAQRTRSLVGPIVLHSLFNGISCVQLLLASP
jgi:membrane protease YdiL (CAAX protease family)